MLHRLNWYVPLHIAEHLNGDEISKTQPVLIGTYHCILQNEIVEQEKPTIAGLNWYVPLHIAERKEGFTFKLSNVLIGTYHCILQNTVQAQSRTAVSRLNWYVPLHIAEPFISTALAP